MPYHGSYLWNLRNKVGADLVLMPGASVLVRNPAGQILLTKRSDNGNWCMPGGSAEIGGSFLDTALNELREETGIAAKPEDLLAFACVSRADIHTIRYPNGDKLHCFAVWFALENFSGKIEIGEEITDARFFDADSLPPTIAKATRMAVDLYKKYKDTGLFQVA